MRRGACLVIALLGVAGCVTQPPPPPQAPVVASFSALGAPHVEPAVVPLAWEVSDPQDDHITCRLDRDGDGVWDDTFDPCQPKGSRNVSTAAAGNHAARIEVSDGTNSTVATASYTVAPPASTESFDIVIRVAGAMDADVVAAFESAASRWEQAIVGGISDHPVDMDAGSCGYGSEALNAVVDDLVVNVSMHTTAPAGALAWACVFGPDGLPRVGYVEVDPDILANFRTINSLEEMALHELGHTLGFGIPTTFNHLVDGLDGNDPRYRGPRANAESSALGRSLPIPIMTIDAVAQPHWESAFLGPEIMASIPDGSAVSRMTIAALADFGYAVDLDAADPYTPPLPADTCIWWHPAPPQRCW